MLKKIYFLLMFSFLCGMAIAAPENRDTGMTPADGFFLPKGDAKAGEQAFTKLKCMACHWVRNQTNLKEPVAELTGPMLGPKQAGYSPGWIADTIVSPSHTIANESDGEAEGGKLSRMGEFADTMTVRELVDIVAYIRSLDDTVVPTPADES